METNKKSVVFVLGGFFSPFKNNTLKFINNNFI